MLEMFAVAPSSEPPSTTVAATATDERPPQAQADMERGPINTTFILEPLPIPPHWLTWSMSQWRPFKPWRRDWPALSHNSLGHFRV